VSLLSPSDLSVSAYVFLTVLLSFFCCFLVYACDCDDDIKTVTLSLTDSLTSPLQHELELGDEINIDGQAPALRLFDPIFHD
jgi:hypothetical protein